MVFFNIYIVEGKITLHDVSGALKSRKKSRRVKSFQHLFDKCLSLEDESAQQKFDLVSL